MTSVLILRALGLGDTVAAVPALRALREAVDGELVLAGPAEPGRLLLRDGLIDRLLPAKGLDAPPRIAGPVDVAVNLHGRGPRSHRLLAALDPGRLVGFAAPGYPEGPTWDPEEHERARWCRLIAETWPVAADPEAVSLTPPARSGRRGHVLIHPGAADEARRWPAARWARVAAPLAADYRVIVTGSATEGDLARTVAESAGLEADAVQAGRTTIDELAALVAAARLVLCGDTGCAHLAYAFRTPAVVLFGPTPRRHWGPPVSGPYRALRAGSGRGDPHAPRPDPRLMALGVDEVLAAARSLLDDSDGVVRPAAS